MFNQINEQKVFLYNFMEFLQVYKIYVNLLNQFYGNFNNPNLQMFK